MGKRSYSGSAQYLPPTPGGTTQEVERVGQADSERVGQAEAEKVGKAEAKRIGPAKGVPRAVAARVVYFGG